MESDDPRIMVRSLPWPFPDGRFPAQLGAVVMRTVLDGHLPALQVVHFPDNSWGVADGVNDPNDDGEAVATHLWHVVSTDCTLEELASLPVGFVAGRTAVGETWQIEPFGWDDDPGDDALH